ncbi:uncharacterized protein PHACADRAFT_254219 [Phanerochaete carnosa HHB-10118-sp]|uniref:Uncharacterized protein n=1 Tax=Phanerochaete carnosa (strain HHB-10118-sp) TaxID=650164 RepID=K5WCB7_PHACS|nr:uncharacterized protein PHACADRAFT_254219 [Phanerochaete carnosa HHB-10118-sp]EKM56860.1 hypothetical protein PHACADRAFT_254219 [Phanerochaete carnosa HHB-10118-sp]
MAKHDVPLDITFLVSIWLEALVYGFFMCLFCASVYINVALRRAQDVHSRVMFGIGILLFFMASMHVAMNCYRMVMAYVIKRDAPGGPAAYIGALAPWDHVFKDTIYATQEIFGDAVAIYRTWVVWGRDWRPIALPSVLLVVSLVSGYSVCGLYTTESSSASVFDPRLLRWITTFYAISVVQSGLTTGLMAYRIWQTDRRSIKFRTNQEGNLMPILRILIESASIQFMAEVILLSLYSANYNAQYLLLELITPLVGITFNAISVRIALHQSEIMQNASKSFGAIESAVPHAINPVATIGSIPMRRMNPTQSINIQIKKDVEAFGDHQSGDTDFVDFERKVHDEEIAQVQ